MGVTCHQRFNNLLKDYVYKIVLMIKMKYAKIHNKKEKMIPNYSWYSWFQFPNDTAVLTNKKKKNCKRKKPNFPI